MRTTMQTNGGEVVVHGTASFTAAIVNAVDVYEQGLIRQAQQKKNELSRNLSKATVGKRKIRPYKKRRGYTARRWTEDEINRFRRFVADWKEIHGTFGHRGRKAAMKEFHRSESAINNAKNRYVKK